MYFRMIFFWGVLFLSGVGRAKVFLTLQEALTHAFSAEQKCKTQTETFYLTAAQKQRAQNLSGLDVESGLVVRYTATCDGKKAGHAYTDTHRVRTHPETLFIAVDSSGAVLKVEVLTFDEPLDYIPRGEWYGAFETLLLNPDLQLKRKIPFVTGASLTAAATVQATRRILALDQVLGNLKP